METKTVRFVRLSLRDGESLSHWQSQPDDEGYHSRASVWRREGGAIHQEITIDGRDCDGRHSYYYDAVCPVERATARPHVSPGSIGMPGLPAWESVSESQRDYTAEAAGY